MTNLPQFILKEIPLDSYTTYKIGGNAKYFVEIDSMESLKEAILWAKENEIPFWILGKGSNIVMSDEGYEGLVLYIGPKKYGKIDVTSTGLKAQAGALLHSLVKTSVDSGLQGIENLGGIPGTLGGGIYINAGAFDQELVQVIKTVTSIDFDGHIRTRTNKECNFSYRHSNFFNWNEIILEATLDLKPKDSEQLREQMTQILIRRKSKQPLEFPNAGSMYKRPPGTFAGKLIQEADLRGFELGGAAISDKHANFVINKNKASAQDIYDLSEEVINRVKENSGITIEKEQIFVGNFKPWPR
jgi:UDP-N-acetylmuramate dehydrogenase